MKKYTIKNYKGNLVESLKKFSEKYKGMRIVEAKQDGKMLKIKADLKEATISSDVSFSTIINKYKDIHTWLETEVFGSDTDMYDFYYEFWEFCYCIDRVLTFDIPLTEDAIIERVKLIRNAAIKFQKVVYNYRPENTDEFNEISTAIDEFINTTPSPNEDCIEMYSSIANNSKDIKDIIGAFCMDTDIRSEEVINAFIPYAANLAYHAVNNLGIDDTPEEREAWIKDYKTQQKQLNNKISSFRKDTIEDRMYMTAKYSDHLKWNTSKPSKFRFNNVDRFLCFISFGRIFYNQSYTLDEFKKELEDFAKGTFLREDEETNESLYDYADEPQDGNETGDPQGMRFSNIKELADALAEYAKSEKEMGWNYNFLHVRDENSNEEVEVKKANVKGLVAYWGNGHLVISFGGK